MGDRCRVVLQVPEVCHWNPYVELAEQHLLARGVAVARPGLCLDGPFSPPTSPPQLDPFPDIVHVHWPEMLAAWYGVSRALAVLQEVVEQGTCLVQTVHDLHPHEPTSVLVAYLHEVDALTSGVHFFSDEHERQARLLRPKLPEVSTHLLHPAFPTQRRPARRTLAPANEMVLGCFGRIRPYKRYSEFGHAFGQVAHEGFRLLIAGAAHTDQIHRDMQELAQTYPCVSYVPGFASPERFAELVSQVDWVALPYRRVFSSGILVAAIQAQRPVLLPRPTGALAYAVAPSLEVVDPWDDVTAIRTWMTLARQPRAPVPQGILPTWDAAADHLIDFYDAVIAHSTPNKQRPRAPQETQ
jgi:glycosyltransferase involved in cell wall biosynthesis